MSRMFFLLVAVVAMLGLGAAPVFAQARVFVSGHGDDGNPCSLSAPCRSFQQAHNTVLAGGEIVALDAAGYGPLNIGRAVTVTAIGIEAAITSNGTGIQISAGAGDVVTIRGLTLIGGATSTNGISITSAKSVTIRDTSISGFPGAGISVNPSPAFALDLELRDVAVNNNGVGLSFSGAQSPSTANRTLLVTGSSFTGNTNGNGINVFGSSGGTVTATFADVAAAANSGFGIFVSATAVPMAVMVTGAKLVNNAGNGLAASGAFTTVFVDRTQITGNVGMGWQATTSAVVKSYTNNAVNGNGNDALNGVTQITSE